MEPQTQTLKEKIINYVKKFGLPLLAVVGGLAILLVLSNMFTSGVRIKSGSESLVSIPGAPMGHTQTASYDMVESEMAYYDGGYDGYGGGNSYMPAPLPPADPTGYMPNLEGYETTDYNVTARTKAFDEACSLLNNLKARDDIHFKYLSEDENYCSTNFYVEEGKEDGVVEQLKGISNVEISRVTNSVTRQRQRLQTESDILAQQLASVEATLTEAERQYSELTEVAWAANDAAALTEAIRDKLNMIENLNQRRISLVSRLQSFAQRSAELEERIGVVAFNVSITRANPSNSQYKDSLWEEAWDELDDAVTSFLIGLTAYFGIFLLRVVQYVIYGIVLLVLFRFGWKLLQQIWKL